MNNLGRMSQTFNKIFYLGSFCGENPFQDENGNNNSRMMKRRQKSFEECLVDHLELAQLNGHLPQQGNGHGVEIEVEQNCIRLHNSNSPFPFERIPLHKIIHFVVYSNGINGMNAALMENGPISSQNRQQRPKMEYKFHLFRGGQNDEGQMQMKKFCDKLQAKFDEISQKVTRIDP